MIIRPLLTLFFVTSISLLFAQETKYLVEIIDSETKKPVENVHIIVKRTNTLISSDSNGYFELIGGRNVEIIISHVNYESKSVILIPRNAKVSIQIVPLSHELKPLILREDLVFGNFRYNLKLWKK